jgi:hypothetical protein
MLRTGAGRAILRRKVCPTRVTALKAALVRHVFARLTLAALVRMLPFRKTPVIAQLIRGLWSSLLFGPLSNTIRSGLLNGYKRPLIHSRILFAVICYRPINGTTAI